MTNSQHLTSRPPRSIIARSGIVAMTIAFGLTFGAILGLQALGYLGFTGKQTDKIAEAIMTGTDIAAAIAMFAGPVAIGGWVLLLLKKALKKGSKWAVIY